MRKNTRFRIGEKVTANITIKNKVKKGQDYTVIRSYYDPAYNVEFIHLEECSGGFAVSNFDPHLPSYGMMINEKIKTLIEIDDIQGSH